MTKKISWLWIIIGVAAILFVLKGKGFIGAITGTETIARSFSTTKAVPGSTFQLTYTVNGATPKWVATIQDNVTGGCLFPNSDTKTKTLMISEDGNTKTITITAPAIEANCVFRGLYQFPNSTQKVFSQQTVSICSDACTTTNTKQCSGTSAYQTCGNYDADSCLEWSSVTACPSGQTCSGSGVCATPCTNECSTSGSKQCSSTTGYQTCGNYDSDSCLEWSTATICSSGQTCSGAGVCACTTQSSSKCHTDMNIGWFNSCNAYELVKETCQGGTDTVTGQIIRACSTSTNTCCATRSDTDCNNQISTPELLSCGTEWTNNNRQTTELLGVGAIWINSP